MTNGVVTVGVAAVQVPIGGSLSNGARLLGRADNTGNVYVGTSAGVTTSTGNLLPKGDPATSIPYTVPGTHFRNGTIWVIADDDAQEVDWSAD